MNYRRRRENYLLLIKEGVFPKDENSFVSRELVGCASLLRNRLLDVTQRSPQKKLSLGGALRDIQKTAANYRSIT